MQKAIEVRVDLEVGAGYVGYRALEEGETIARSARISEDVVIDYDAAGDLLGIELISIVPEAVTIAEAFATQQGLAFPDLEGSSIAKLAVAHG